MKEDPLIRSGTLTGIAVAIAIGAITLELGARGVLEDPVDANLAGLVEERSAPRLEPGEWVTKHGVEIHLNELGFRSALPNEPIPPRSADEIRIAVVDDSETLCLSLPYAECMPGRLDRVLRRELPDDSFEVFGFAVASTNSQDHLEMLKAYVIGIEPDLVVLNHNLNDIEALRSARVDLSHWYDRSLVVRYLRHHRFQRQLDAFIEARVKQYRLIRRSKGVRGVAPDVYASMYSSELWDANLRTFREMKRVSEAAGAGFLVVSNTAIGGVESFEPGRYPFRDSLEVLRTLGDHDIPFVDTLPAFARAGKPGSHYYVTPDDAHKNAEGNRILVENLVAHPEFRASIERIRASRRGNERAGVSGSETAIEA